MNVTHRAASRTLRIKVKPNARVERIEPLADGGWLAHVKAPPVDGKANAALIALIAAHFGIRKVDVVIRSGAASKSKLVQIPA